MTRKALCFLLLIVLCPLHLATGQTREQELFYDIQREFSKNNRTNAIELTNSFFKKFPKSDHIPDIRMMIADSEKNPDEAVKEYRKIVRYYSYYPGRAKAQLKLCKIFFLRGEWRELESESRKGIDLFGKTPLRNEFIRLLIIVSIHKNNYNLAENQCGMLMQGRHDYNDLASNLLVKAQIIKRREGLNSRYLHVLRELALGFPESDIMPTTLYLLGSFYQYYRDTDRAYSAFLDLTKRYPRSPEALFAKRNLQTLECNNPSYISYIPTENNIRKTPSIDISPEISLDSGTPQKVIYSLSVGPFDSKWRMNRMKKLLSQFGTTKTVQLKKGYLIYLGDYSSVERALNQKIRLAEELGVNATIVRINDEESKRYIYGDN